MLTGKSYDDLLKELNDLQIKYDAILEENNYLKKMLVNNKVNIPYIEIDNIAENGFSSENKDNEGSVTNKSSVDEKIELFKSLFTGRADVCAKRWENQKGKSGYSPYCKNEWIKGICEKPRVSCSKCKKSNFIHFNNYVIKKHLLGEVVIGVYAIDKDDMCRFLVMDFDKSTWKEDVKTIRDVCLIDGIPIYVEISRSGNGGHLWFFFSKLIKASLARKFGMMILEFAMTKNNNIKFDSYDRLIPNQDFLQKDGFGNLIALPLQKQARQLKNTVFVDENFEEIKDQWSLLSKVKKINTYDINKYLKKHENIRNDEFKSSGIYNRKEIKVNKNDFPTLLEIESSNGLKINKNKISAKGIFFLRSLASYKNPEFYSKQAMRMSTFKTSRIIIAYEENEKFIILPRGIQENLVENLNVNGINYKINELKECGKNIDVEFTGELRAGQIEAFNTLNSYSNGVLSATTGFGKTVIGARLIGEKKISTLILVHTKELALQWIDRLETFLDIKYEIAEPIKKTRGRKKKITLIGQLGGGKNSLTGCIDVALMQSMTDKEKNVKSLIDDYGMIIVDECHHVSSTTFTRILFATKAKYVYGLTATPIRKDGHHPIIFMQCGPIRYKVDAKKESLKRSFKHYIIPRFTSVRKPLFQDESDWHISNVYKYICESNARNIQIVKDLDAAIDNNRNPLILTERSTHIERLLALLQDKPYEVIELSGRLSLKKRKLAIKRVRSLTADERVVIIATGKLIGEGFDLARLDTLFMAMPISWKGRVIQYAGRLHREYEGKDEVQIYDYIDVHISVLEKMYHKRLNGYRAVGYQIKTIDDKLNSEECIYDSVSYWDKFLNDIEYAKKSIVISSPYIQKKKFEYIRKILVEKYKSGVRVVLCIKEFEDYSEKKKISIFKSVSLLRKEGINIIQISKNQHKFAIVDQEVVWYGGINILNFNREDDSIIRVVSNELSNELLDIVELEDGTEF